MDYLLKNYYPEFYGKKPFLERGALVPAKIAEKLSDSRGLICVGDAGGFVEPLTGAGINFGVMSAFEAAKIIDGAFKENDVSKVNEFYPKMKELGWPQLFKVQSAFLKTVNKRQFIYNNFFPAFFGKGGYEKTMGKALKLMGVKNYFAKGVSIQ